MVTVNVWQNPEGNEHLVVEVGVPPIVVVGGKREKRGQREHRRNQQTFYKIAT
jgi:hypothetical protein